MESGREGESEKKDIKARYTYNIYRYGDLEVLFIYEVEEATFEKQRSKTKHKNESERTKIQHRHDSSGGRRHEHGKRANERTDMVATSKITLQGSH